MEPAFYIMHDPKTIGRYHLIRRIAVGGMAEVFLAETEPAHGIVRRCVVKRILPNLAFSNDFSKAFIDEARIGMSLNHPNLVTILDFDEVDGQPFLVLEYVDGPNLATLSEVIAKQGERMPVQIACHIIINVLKGLSYAHNAVDETGIPLQIIHRDVNPPNILCSLAGTIKLSDFGIAHAASRQTSTQFGHLKGKIPYMSPEQAQGHRLDPRSDLFACGVVLFEILTGGRLFTGAGEMEVLRQVREASVHPPSIFRPDLDERLDQICLKALQKDRDRRYPDAQAFLKEMEEYATQRFSGNMESTLADMLRQMGSLLDTNVSKRRKTAVFNQIPPIKKAEQITLRKPDKSPHWKFTGSIAMLVLVALAAVIGWRFFLPDKKTTRAFIEPSGTVLELNGGHGGFAFIDQVLVGRTPLKIAATPGSKRKNLEVMQGGMRRVDSGITIKPGQTRVVNLSNAIGRVTGTVVFPSSVSRKIEIDGKSIPKDNQVINLPAGIHHVRWVDENRVYQKTFSVGDGQIKMLVPPSS